MIETLYVVQSEAGRHRDLSRGSREQAFWDEHAAFIDALVEEGFIALGGPFPETGGAMLVVRASDETEVRNRLASDPWFRHEIRRLVSVTRWEIFIDQLRGETPG